MKITVVGTGYVGLVTGTCFAETGNSVLCVDIDAQKVEDMKSGIVPIYEPGLEPLFIRNKDAGRLDFTTSLKEGVEHGDIIFLALPTPEDEDGSADLKYILGVADDLSKLITSYKVIIDKSTVPVGTSDKVAAALGKHLNTDLFDVVSNPEFLREGVAVDDFMKPDRVVIGTSSDKAAKIMKELYNPFVRQGNPIYIMDERSAEMTKYAANSYLATRITFMNEIANICEKLGADVDKVRQGMGSDSRIGKRFLFPGIGYGGSCFPKDVKALVKMAHKVDYNFKILESVTGVNEVQKVRINQKIASRFGSDLTGLTFALWGLAFKPNTDDIREAPSLSIITDLLSRGAKIKAFDPEAMENVQKIYGDKVEFCAKGYDAIQGADALIIATEWTVFRTPDFEFVKNALKNPVIFDGRNLYDVKKMRDLGFEYFSIGR